MPISSRLITHFGAWFSELAAHLSAYCALQWNRFVTTLPLEAHNLKFEMRRKWFQNTKVLWRQRCIVDAHAVGNVAQPQNHCTAQHQPTAQFNSRHIKKTGH